MIFPCNERIIFIIHGFDINMSFNIYQMRNVVFIVLVFGKKSLENFL